MPWGDLLSLLAALAGIVYLVLQWVLRKKTARERSLQDQEERRDKGDEAIYALETRDLNSVRENVLENIDRLEAMKREKEFTD